jgi:NitT/TauT family transport system ATP-binding protein
MNSAAGRAAAPPDTLAEQQRPSPVDDGSLDTLAERSAAPAVVRVDNLVMRYGAAEPVVDGASLTVAAGEVASLVGPSGSGKSTILRAIAGLHAAAGGRIDRAVTPREMGFLFQDDALLPWRTARQNVALGMRLHGRSKAEAADEAEHWLARLGIAGFGDRYPRQLSGGQRKRVALAQVLALRPKLLLMDEPFASLDAIVRHRVTQDLLSWVEGAGIAVLLVTHDLEEAQALSDTVHLLSRGPRARIRSRYEVAIPRPRDLIGARGHPSFAPLLKRIWNDLSDEVDVHGGGI